MAMNGKVLGRKIADRIIDKDAPKKYKERIYKQWEGIGEDIVDHILKNMDIIVTPPGMTPMTAEKR